jgi:hypothetical protein
MNGYPWSVGWHQELGETCIGSGGHEEVLRLGPGLDGLLDPGKDVAALAIGGHKLDLA